MAKIAQQRLARLLRQQGWSIKAISKHLCVSTSSVSRWVRDIELTPEQLERLNALAHHTRREKARQTRILREKLRREEESRKAQEFFERFSNEPLFLAGLTGYWAEGSKTLHHVRVANTDPDFLRLMLTWFKRYCGVKDENFSLKVYMHADLGITEEECKRFWEGKLGVPVERLYWKPQTGYNYRRRRSYYGTAYLTVRKCKGLFKRISEWIRCLSRKISS